MNLLRAIGRAVLLALVKIFFPRDGRPAEPIDASLLRKILVIRTDTRVGNVLLTTPLIRALRKALPDAQIDLLVASGKEKLVEGLASRIIPFTKRDFFKSPYRFWRLVSRLRREKYDAVIEAGHWHAFSFTSLWLTRATRAPIRLGHERGLSGHFLTHQVVKDPKIVREVASKLELLLPLGIRADGEWLETTVDRANDVAESAERIVRMGSVGSNKAVVGLNPGARKADHRWPAEEFGRLAQGLKERLGVCPLVLWGPGEESIADAVIRASNGTAILAPPTDLAQLAGVFRRCVAVVTNDTGPMHLAAATGVPVVAVLMADDGARWSHSERFTGVMVKGGSGKEVEKVFEAVSSVVKGASPS